MNKKICIIGAIILIGIVGFFIFRANKGKTNESVNNQITTYVSEELGVQFDYKTGPNGYVVDERIPADLGDLVRNIILVRAEDYNNIPVNSEGPAVLMVSVYNNSEKQFSKDWAMKNPQYSIINLIRGEVSNVVIGGANAIRYMADGLYVSENIVVASGDSIYVITGQFLDQDSDLRRDFAPLVDSFKFIQKAGQE